MKWPVYLLDVAHWNYLLYFHFHRKIICGFSLFQTTFYCRYDNSVESKWFARGAINQIIYGVAFYLMEKLVAMKIVLSKTIFAMYFWECLT